MRDATAKPSMPGSITSSTMQIDASGRFAASASSAASPVSTSVDVVAFGLEVEAQARRDVRFVFDDEERWPCR